MESVEFHHARALLEWQVELGATDAICDAPLDRYEAPATLPAAPAARGATKEAARGAADQRSGPVAAQPKDAPSPVAAATAAAAAAQTLEDLRAAMAGFDPCELRLGARNMVFSAGKPGASVMIVTEMPSREEDRTGAAFPGETGAMLDLMFQAIGLGRTQERGGLYIANVLPWRAPQGRDPTQPEIAMMRPFLERHITLADPKIIVAMGNISCEALLGQRGISRLRGQWGTAMSRPVLPLYHPAYVRRNPAVKPAVWHDLLSLRSRLSDG